MPQNRLKLFSEVLVAAVCIGVLFFLMRSSSVPQKPEDRILGTWKKTYEKTGHGVIDLSPFDTEYLGFVRANGDSFMRWYSKTDKPADVWQINRWLVKEGADKNLVLQEYFYDNSIDNGPLEQYSISFVGNNEYVLKQLNSDGSLIQGDYSREIHYKRVKSASEENNKNFTRTNEENKKICDTVLYGKVIDSDAGSSILLPLSCTLSMGKNEPLTTFSFLPSGNLEIESGGKISLTLVNEAENRGISLINFYSSGTFMTPGSFALIDINYDGYLDMKVQTPSGAYNFYYDYYAYNPKTHSFDETPLLSSIVNPGEDLVHKTITSYNKGRGLGDMFNSETYQFKNGEYITIREENQNISNDCLDDVSCRYLHTVKELVNGKMVVTKKEVLTTKDIFGDQVTNE